MNIDLAKLSGVLKTLGDLSDTDKNSKIEGKEVSVFQSYADNALKSGAITQDEYSAIFGLEKSTQTKNVTTPPDLSKKDIKRNKNAVLSQRSLEVIDSLREEILR